MNNNFVSFLGLLCSAITAIKVGNLITTKKSKRTVWIQIIYEKLKLLMDFYNVTEPHAIFKEFPEISKEATNFALFGRSVNYF